MKTYFCSSPKDPERVVYELPTVNAQGTASGNGITITFEKTADWDEGNGDRGFTANITILNETGSTLDDWDLEFEFLAEITNMWNASYTQENNNFTILPANWNSSIANGSSRNFGFNGVYNGVFQEPSVYILSTILVGDQTSPTPITPACILDTTFNVTSHWSTSSDTYGFVANVQMTNTGSDAVNWELDFDLAADISNMWNASFQNEDNHYVVTPDSWNVRIEPNETRSFGFQASYTGSSQPEPQNIVCNKDDIPPNEWQETTLGNGVGSNTYDASTDTFNISLENPDSDPTSYLIYQTLQEDPLYFEACFGSELPNNAEVGLIFAQGIDNGVLQTPWIRVVRTEFGARVTAEDTDGSTFIAFGSLSDPLCFRISKNGNTAYVYESKEALTTQLTTSSSGEIDRLIAALNLNFDNNEQIWSALNVTINELTSASQSFTASPITVGKPPVGSVIANVSVSTDFGEVPLTVDFDASASEGNNLTYEWHFGDEDSPDTISATGVTASHTYTAEGDYIAVLTVTDDAGMSQQAEVEIVVVPPDPNPEPETEAVISNSGTIVNFTSDVVEFSAYGSQGAYPLQYHWDFGDGTNYTSDEPVADHIYANPGDYTVELTVIDDSGNTSTAEFVTTVLPLMDDMPSIRSDIGQLSVTFDAISSNPNLDFRWDFGDGNSTVGPVVSHQYEDLGTYLINLQVMDLRVDPPKLALEDKTLVTMWDKRPTAYFEADMYDRLESINYGYGNPPNYYHYTISGRAPFVVKLDSKPYTSNPL